MKPRLSFLVLLSWLFPALARAHLGSPDVFYDGMVGPWLAHITIRMPGVVPGQAEISAQVRSQEPLSVSYTPLSARIAASNAPPAELARPVPGETNLYGGDLWLMTIGAYSIEVRIRGAAGEGVVQIPVNSIATTQLPLPPSLGAVLLVMGLILFGGGMAIIAAAAGESTLPPGVPPGKTERRKYWIAAVTTGVVLALALVGGKKWWDVSEQDFRSRLHAGGWPDLASEVRVSGSQRILRLTLGKSDLDPKTRLDLAPDHGKLLHLFVVRQPNHDAFAHLHPVRRGNADFEVALPPLPEGDYELFCDLTLESGLSSTATNSIHLPPPPESTDAVLSLQPDPDDSWATNASASVKENIESDTLCQLPGGTQVIWKAHPPVRVRRDAALQFEVRDSSGKPALLQPYMGMMSHAAILRADDRVFAHLHPSGNYSMAAQMFFDAKLARETGADTNASTYADMLMTYSNLDVWCGPPPVEGGAPAISLPYEFPSPGDYRVWVQIKTGGQILTAAFDTTVQ